MRLGLRITVGLRTLYAKVKNSMKQYEYFEANMKYYETNLSTPIHSTIRRKLLRMLLMKALLPHKSINFR